MTRIKAIETRYAGHRFRSRLEARWAVFFDSLGVEWRYEPEGFETSAGWYLPDFYLPVKRRWIEVKGGDPTQHDLDRGAAFAEAKWCDGEKYAFLVGDIPREPEPGFPVKGVRTLAYTPLMIVPGVDVRELPADTRGWLPTIWVPARPERLTPALAAARSARFEHGETPRAS